MFVMVTYDVAARRTEKFRKLLSRYLGHEQFSIFYGDLRLSVLEKLRRDLNKLVIDGDRVLEFVVENRHNIDIALLTKDGRAEGMPTRKSDARHKANSVVL
jgi:CRISPR-associated protein Cas2